MLSINMSDVMNVVSTIQGYLIAIGVAVVIAIVAIIIARRFEQPLKKRVRGFALIFMIAVIAVCVTLICTGPMSTMLDLVTGGGTIDPATAEEAKALAIKIGEEGIVLVENDDDTLPLAEGSKINVFGWGSTSPILGGAGSGALNDAYEKVGILDSLADAGFETNEELTQFYTDYCDTRPEVGMWAQDWTLPEPNVSTYSDNLMANAKSFSDTAVIVIARSGGEGADLPEDMAGVVNGTYQDGTTYKMATYDDTLNSGNDWDDGDHYLQLSNREEDLIDLVCSNFDKVVLIYNGANAFELGFVENYPQIKSVLWTAGQGHVGMTALGEIMKGAVNPSGKLIDTYVYEIEDSPWWNNFGDFNYTNMDEYAATDMFGNPSLVSFVNYNEGIYVGYRFYETAAEEGLIDYDKVVQYPFGHGLSYTTFEQKMGDITDNGEELTFDVTVTNTGSVAGKDVVQVYVNPPYTDGGIEKASANLVAFAKTKLLEAGESETLTITVDKDDLMSYDYLDAQGYVLEKGNYEISINADSHNVLDSKTYKVDSTVTYNGDNKRESDKVTATNQFDYAAGDVTYLSRAGGFKNYDEAIAGPASTEMPEEYKDTFYNISNYLTPEATAADEDPNAEAVTTGNNQGIMLETLRGVDKDDSAWDTFMDQLTLEEMDGLISLGGYQTAAIDSVGKVRTNDCDGPASINNNFTGVGSIGFPVGVVISATFNTQLAYEFGQSIGTMANEMDVSGWYAPAMNIHRTAFAGRNFEYYSEDPVLSAYIAAAAVKGSQEQGVYAYMKHFALNDQECNRCDMLCTWSNEQAIREIYLRPFERCVKDSDCQACMSSFNYIGNRWSGGSSSIQKTVLRGEWGFDGFVETDYFGVYGYMSADQAIRNGSDLMLVNYPTATNNVQFHETNGAQQAMRASAKNIMYVVVNSRAYDPDNLKTGMAPWMIVLIVVDVLIAGLLIWWAYKLLKKEQKEG